MKTEIEVKEKIESISDQIEYWKEAEQQAEREQNNEVKDYSKKAVSSLTAQQNILKWVFNQ